MPYKDPEKQKAAQARYFQENKESLRIAQNKKRNQFRKYIHEIKALSPCKDCGMFYPHYIMDFDHLPGFEKLYNIGSDFSKIGSLKILKEEIEKCELVCANCHRHRSFMRLVKVL